MFKYEVNSFNNNKVMASVKVFWQFDFECQGHYRVKATYYVAHKSYWPEQYRVHVWNKSIHKYGSYGQCYLLTIWPWMPRSLMGQGHISMWQTNALVLSNVVFKYGVYPFINTEVMANVSIFDNLTLKVKVIKGSTSHIYVVDKSFWPKQYCIEV